MESEIVSPFGQWDRNETYETLGVSHFSDTLILRSKRTEFMRRGMSFFGKTLSFFKPERIYPKEPSFGERFTCFFWGKVYLLLIT